MKIKIMCKNQKVTNNNNNNNKIVKSYNVQ